MNVKTKTFKQMIIYQRHNKLILILIHKFEIYEQCIMYNV